MDSSDIVLPWKKAKYCPGLPFKSLTKKRRWEEKDEDTPYTSVDKAIMKQITDGPHGATLNRQTKLELYDLLRNTYENYNLIVACDDIVMLNFNLTSEMNTAQPFKGQLTMRDLGSTYRSLNHEEYFSNLGDDGLRFCIAKIADNQIYRHRPSTYVFDLNYFDLCRESLNAKDIVEKFKAYIIKTMPKDLFEKKWLIFPFFHCGEGLVTMIENPYIPTWKPVPENNEPVPCTILHIGTPKMQGKGRGNFFRLTVAPSLFRMLQLFVDIVRPLSTLNCTKEKAIVKYKSIPWVPRKDKQFAFLYILEKVVGRSHEVSEWPKMFEEIGSDRNKMLEEMETLRKWLGVDMCSAVMKDESNVVAQHLMRKRASIGMYEKSEREAGRLKSQKELMDEEHAKLQRLNARQEGAEKEEEKNDDDDDVIIINDDDLFKTEQFTTCIRPRKVPKQD